MGENDTMLLESGAGIEKNRGKLLQKDREMGVNPREYSVTLKKMTKQGLGRNFGWKQSIYKDLKKEGTNMENMVEGSAKTQNFYSTKLLL